MDDQQNQQQPGQSFEPQPQVPQQPAQYQPPQVPQQPVQPQVAPQVAPQFQQPQYPQQPPANLNPQPQQPPQPQYPPAQQINNPASLKQRLPGLKKIVILAVIVLTLLGGLILLTKALDGSLDLESTDPSSAPFTISVPAEWDVDYLQADSLWSIRAFPTSDEDNGIASINFQQDNEIRFEGQFRTESERRISVLQSSEYSKATGLVIENFDSADSVDGDRIEYSISFTAKEESSAGTNIINQQAKYVLVAGEPALFVVFAYDDNYSELGNSIDAIMASYQDN